jgi:hypothetical protein
MNMAGIKDSSDRPPANHWNINKPSDLTATEVNETFYRRSNSTLAFNQGFYIDVSARAGGHCWL